MLKPREIDEYLLPTERRVIRVRQHWAVLWKELTLTALFVLAMVVVEDYLPNRIVADNLTFYLVWWPWCGSACWPCCGGTNAS
jgi:hypothetical protein